MQTIFNSLYSGLVGLFYHKTASYGLYKAEIFNNTGWATLGAGLGLMLLFYYVVGFALNQRLSKPLHWCLTLLLAAGLGAVLANHYCTQLGAPSESYRTCFTMVNCGVAMLWFVVFSTLFKRWSPVWPIPYRALTYGR